MGTIKGTWKCKDCGAGIAYTATITDSQRLEETQLIKAVIDNDGDLRAHAASHGHEGGTEPLVVIVGVLS